MTYMYANRHVVGEVGAKSHAISETKRASLKRSSRE
jgi:hypothetical protein